MRTAESHRNPEALGGAECDVGPDIPGRGDQRERQQVGAERHQGAPFVRLLDERRPVGEASTGTGQLRDHAEELPFGKTVAQVSGDDLDTEWLGAGGQHGGGLGEDIDVDSQSVGRSAHRPVHQGHRLGGGGAFVEHRSVGDIEAGEIGDHGLEIQQRLQPALADLRLVRRVRGVPGRVLQHVAQQHRRGQRVVVALTDHRHVDGVGVGHHPQFGQRLMFGDRCRQCFQTRCRAVGTDRVEDRGRQRFGRQLVERCDADDAEHGDQRVGIKADMAGGEVLGHWHSSRWT